MQLGGGERNWRASTAGQTSTSAQQWDFGDYLSAGLGAAGSVVGMGAKLGAFGGGGADTSIAGMNPSGVGLAPTAPGSSSGLGSLGVSSLSMGGTGGVTQASAAYSRTYPSSGGNWMGR